MDESALRWIFGIVLAVVTALVGVIWKSLDRQIERLGSKGDKLATDVARLQTQTELFWNAMGSKAASILHSPHTPELDVLLDKWNAHRLTLADAETLVAMLQEIEAIHEPHGTKLASVMLLLAIKRRFGI